MHYWHWDGYLTMAVEQETYQERLTISDKAILICLRVAAFLTDQDPTHWR